MEKDIKTIKERLSIIESLCTDDCINKTTVIQPLKYAIENLIARNKDLEKYKKYYETEKVVWSRKDYISKDKVRELQDKYKNKIEKLESKKIWNEPVDTIYKNRYTNYFNAYEELLEGDK